MTNQPSNSHEHNDQGSSAETAVAYRGVFALLYVGLLVACAVVWVKNFVAYKNSSIPLM